MANYDYMSNYLFTVYQEVDNIFNDSAQNRENKNLLVAGHYIIMIL